MLAQERWGAAWRSVGVQPPEELLSQLLARYSQPHRFYHTLQHLEECFAVLAPATHFAEHLAEVELALWFHDAVYDTRAQHNEEQSARWAEQALLAAGASQVIAGRIGNLVVVTKHNAVPEGEDARLLVDVDLSILGAAEERFAEYERQVREEYRWVAEAAFRQGRARVLASFLERPSIYSTSWFAVRLEGRARANLQRSLGGAGCLTSGSSCAAPGRAAAAASRSPHQGELRK
jgi:predicted metal-dependent HD superfamily phosphohydrolase